MICYMHEGNPYGHLKVGNKVILAPNLASMVGSTLDVVEGWLDELFEAGVFQYAEDNAIFSKRMIRDENLRQLRAAGGIKGGNPNLKDNHKVNLKPNLKDETKVKQKPTPTSSSSSSSSSSINTPLPPKGELFDLFWKAYPKKVGKDAAYKAFAKRKPDEQLVKTMIASVRRQADTEQWKKDGGQFIPHASTWLNEGRWQDETEIGAEQDWRITRKGVEDMAEKLGLGRWNQMCQFDQYRNSVVTEATQRGLT